MVRARAQSMAEQSSVSYSRKPFLCPDFLLRLLGTRDIFRGQHRQIFGGLALRLCCNRLRLFAGRFIFRRVNNWDLSFSLDGSAQLLWCYFSFVSKIPSRTAANH